MSLTSSDAPPPLSQAPLPRAVRRLKTAIMSQIRRGPGTVQFPSPNARLGNLLYLWMHAWLEQAEGHDSRVLVTPVTEPWRTSFARAHRDLLVHPSDVRWSDRRTSGTYQAIGTHYSAEQLGDFCRAYLLGSELDEGFAKHAAEAGLRDDGTVTVNVRRGDYYSVAEHRARYGFDIVRYVTEALAVQDRHHPVRRVHLVSDDLAWCRTNLDLGDRQVRWFDERGPQLDFATLASSRRLILTNSTFSYWGGYVAQTRFADAHVVAPLFHARGWLGGRSFHLHPSWVALSGFGEDERA